MDHPEKLGKYRLISLLATGGMGEVFLARQEGPAGFSKTVVIKRILRHLASDQGFVEMFLMEARLAALIAHPNVVQIFELGKQDESYFIAMEYVHGRSLRAIKQQLASRKEVFSPILAARVCAQALLALHYAHTLQDEKGRRLNIVHRDVSPDNVLVSFGGAVKLVDFGIAKAQVGSSTTRTGTLKGKYAYMAPEQISGGQIDCRTDIYACGVLLYELLTGSRPYSAASEPGLIHAIMYSAPRDARDKNPLVPPAMNALIMKALAKDPAERFSTAEEMATALEDFIHDSGETLNQAHIGAFLTDLFGAAAASDSHEQLPAVPLGGGTQALPLVPGKPVVSTVALGLASAQDAPTQMAIVGEQRALLGTEPPVSKSWSARARTHWFAAVASVVAALGVAGVVIWLMPARSFLRSEEEPPPAKVAKAPSKVEVAPPSARKSAEPSTTLPASATASLKAAVPSTEPSDEKDRGASESPERVGSEKSGSEDAPGPSAKREKGREREDRDSSRSSSKLRRAVPAKPGRVALRVNPWAEVFYKGKSLGITPMAPVELPAGKQTFVLRNRELGKQKKVNITVPSGAEVPVKVDMFE